jgi:catechol 2,3-dioxygenase-like lactoylglutathione lyase family enzyme
MLWSKPCLKNVTTIGIDHIQLTVSDLVASIWFFTECLGWREFGEDFDHPSGIRYRRM